jgi:hypothetical protein
MNLISTVKPVVRPPPSMGNGDDLDMAGEHTIDNEEREPAQQEASGVTDVRRRGFGSLSD